MRVYISADIEGVAGVVHSEHTMRDGREHDLARMLMTEEVNACILGALEAGAEDIIVNDSHGTMRNLYPDRLHRKAKLLTGAPKKLAMVEGLSSDCDAALFVGYHTKAGADGVLNHTFSGKVIRSVKVNSAELGEFGLNALTAGCFNVPVVFVSGCHLLAEEARQSVPEIETAVTKQTVSRTAALNLSPAEAAATIREGTKRALGRLPDIPPFIVEGPYTVDIEFMNTAYADAAAILPVYERTGPLTVTVTDSDWLHCYRYIRGAIMVANSVS